MKKLWIVISLLTTFTFSYGYSLNLGVNINQGDIEFKDGSTQKYDFDGQTIGVQLELTQDLLLGEVGAGISIENDYELKGTNSSFRAMPIYLIGKFYVFPVAVKPYLVAKLGKIMYSNVTNMDDMKDGEFYALGAGITLVDTVQVEALYSLRKNDYGADEKATSKVFTISASYNIN